MPYIFYLILNLSIIAVVGLILAGDQLQTYRLSAILLGWLLLNGLSLMRLKYLGYGMKEAITINGFRIINYRLWWNKIPSRK